MTFLPDFVDIQRMSFTSFKSFSFFKLFAFSTPFRPLKPFGLFKLFVSLLVSLGVSSVSAKTFVYCSEGSPTSFNPQLTSDGTSNNASAHTVYNRLVEFKYGTTEIVPALAESWSVSKDQKTYTFLLRKGVKFHKTSRFTPTRDFNADDVIFSIHRQSLKTHPYHKVGGGTYTYFNGMDMKNIIQGVKKLGDYKIQIVLKQPQSPFLANLTMGFMSILSKEYGDQLLKKGQPGDMDRFPVGTGPFVFHKYVKDTLIRYKRNESYWGSKAKVKKLVFAITPDANVRYQKLRAGECHLIIEPSPADLKAIYANPQLKVMKTSGSNVGYLAMNTTKKPFNNLKVRQAISHALNKKSYIKAIYLGNALEATNPLPPTIWSYNKNLRGYNYSPAKARKLLAQAGYPKGFQAELWTLPVTRPYNPNGKKMGEMMQADLAQVGIKVKLVTYDWPTYLQKEREGEHELLQIGWSGDNGDPDNFLYVLLSCSAMKAGSNAAFWCHKEFDKLVLKAKKISNVGERTKLYERAQEIFQAQAPWVPLAHSVVFRAMRKNVVGYKMSPLSHDRFQFVDLK